MGDDLVDYIDYVVWLGVLVDFNILIFEKGGVFWVQVVQIYVYFSLIGEVFGVVQV